MFYKMSKSLIFLKISHLYLIQFFLQINKLKQSLAHFYQLALNSLTFYFFSRFLIYFCYYIIPILIEIFTTNK